MCVEKNKYRIRPSVAIVKQENYVEIFKSNVRESLRINIIYEKISDLLFQFNGIQDLYEIASSNNIEIDDLIALATYLNNENVLINVDCEYCLDDFNQNARLYNSIEEYSTSTSEVVNKISTLRKKTVLIIGMGAVGTWLTHSLAMNGVLNFILVDDDKVELSNLHRQDMMFENDIESYKVDAVERNLNDIGINNILKINEKLDDSFFEKHDLSFDLAINCSDYPSVDKTSEIISKFCMSKAIPHMIGGGYNLHLTLIGQAVIPGKTACYNCYDHALSKLSSDELYGVKKLHRPFRKIGSFAPLCSLSASITALEAFKILIEAYEYLTITNRRTEFRLETMDFSHIPIPKRQDCSWCGQNGIYKDERYD
jgi:molybdopterin/thiamine biosynthesis adenylyltransferase